MEMPMPGNRTYASRTAVLLGGTTLSVLSAALLVTAPTAAHAAKLPDCPAMTQWAGGYEKNAKWETNDLGSRHWFPAIFAAPETAALFGKPVLECSPEEAKAIAKALSACEKTLTRAKRSHERQPLSEIRTVASPNNPQPNH